MVKCDGAGQDERGAADKLLALCAAEQRFEIHLQHGRQRRGEQHRSALDGERIAAAPEGQVGGYDQAGAGQASCDAEGGAPAGSEPRAAGSMLRYAAGRYSPPSTVGRRRAWGGVDCRGMNSGTQSTVIPGDYEKITALNPGEYHCAERPLTASRKRSMIVILKSMKWSIHSTRSIC